ncbi:hypothetical protein MRB53_033101 [Persea americana]|uniref:Uncharacterized protein n=1 Tax=Persea americana TaxID=3435 RepID=A0ACC2KTT3_PERAE|nr:hypothetical protein MRB53_033101 [Persea americana]
MAMRACMNAYCGATSATQWKKGWQLGSGGFANLCDECGSAYEQLIFCDKFHLNESGWRECNSCGKRAHCGCIASKSSLELLDSGGVECLRCAKNSEASSEQQLADDLCATSPETDPVIVGYKLGILGFEFQNPNHGEKIFAVLVMADEITQRRKVLEDDFRSSRRLDGVEALLENPEQRSFHRTPGKYRSFSSCPSIKGVFGKLEMT